MKQFEKLVNSLRNLCTSSKPSPFERKQELTREERERESSAVNLTFLPSIQPPPYEEYAKVVIEEGIKVVETAGGPAAGPIIKMYKKAGIFVIHK